MTGHAERELDSPPNLLALYGKSLLTGLRGGEELPETELVLRGVRVDVDHLAAYGRVCGLRLSDDLPATYLHVIAFPLAIKIMASPSFPFSLPGLVHIANRITQQRPVTIAEPVDLRVRSQDLRPHPKGRQLDIRAEASVEGEVVWTGLSTYLRRGDGGANDAAGGVELPEPASEQAGPIWRVDSGTGRRYAAVSGDRNPIHLHPLSARLFGFPRAIAHGMWTAARVLGGLEGRLPDSLDYEVAFKRPLLLPSTVRFAVERSRDDLAVAVRSAKDGSPHLLGAVRPGR